MFIKNAIIPQLVLSIPTLIFPSALLSREAEQNSTFHFVDKIWTMKIESRMEVYLERWKNQHSTSRSDRKPILDPKNIEWFVKDSILLFDAWML